MPFSVSTNQVFSLALADLPRWSELRWSCPAGARTIASDLRAEAGPLLPRIHDSVGIQHGCQLRRSNPSHAC